MVLWTQQPLGVTSGLRTVDITRTVTLVHHQQKRGTLVNKKTVNTQNESENEGTKRGRKKLIMAWPIWRVGNTAKTKERMKGEPFKGRQGRKNVDVDRDARQLGSRCSSKTCEMSRKDTALKYLTRTENIFSICFGGIYGIYTGEKRKFL